MTDRTDPMPVALYARVSSWHEGPVSSSRVGMTTPFGPTVMMSFGPTPRS